MDNEENELAKEGVDIQHELEKYEGIIKENKSKIKHWKKEVSQMYSSFAPTHSFFPRFFVS